MSDCYEGELKLLITDLDNLVERKKVEWSEKIRAAEAKLAEERKMHCRTKSVVALKEIEIVKLARRAQYLKERNETAKTDYEQQISSLKDATHTMSENLFKLQAKYSKWRSRCRVSTVQTRDVGTYCNKILEGGDVCEFSTTSSNGLLHSNEVRSQLVAKTLEIAEQKDKLNSVELAFRAQIQTIESQLQELIAMKQAQDKKLNLLKQEKKRRPASRNFRLQWPQPERCTLTKDVSVQGQFRFDGRCTSTMTTSEDLGPSDSDVIIAKLENEIAQKNSRIGELENVYSAAMSSVKQLKVELEENKTALTQKCAELLQEKLRVRPRGRRGFQSKACQSEPVKNGELGVYNKSVQTRAAGCQLSKSSSHTQTIDIEAEGHRMTNIPVFLTEALMVLDESRAPASPTLGQENVLVEDGTMGKGNGSQTVPFKCLSPTNGIVLASQTEVDVSVDDDASHENDTNVLAPTIGIITTEEHWNNHLNGRSSLSNDDCISVPVTAAESTKSVAAAPLAASTSEGLSFSPHWVSGKEWGLDFGDRKNGGCDQKAFVEPSMAGKKILNFTTPVPNDDHKALKVISEKNNGVICSSNFVRTSVSGAGDTWDEHNFESVPRGRDNQLGLALWSNDDIERLAAHFLAKEHEHSTHLEAVIERHLEELRLSIESPPLTIISPAQ